MKRVTRCDQCPAVELRGASRNRNLRWVCCRADGRNHDARTIRRENASVFHRTAPIIIERPKWCPSGGSEP